MPVFSSISVSKILSGIILIAGLISSHASEAQSYPLGLNPPKLKWKEINTEKVQVLYPEELERQGQYVANLVHLLADSTYYSLGNRQQKVSILLQNQNTISNGFVTVGPFRSEFFLTPPQFSFLGNVDWLTGLTIHEYRHVEQFVNAKRSVTKIGSLLFGQNGWGAMAGLALPRWFFEGDAVFYETALTSAGRGRMPDFQNQYRALLHSRKKVPNYEKASATSYKEFIPNHYTLGYFLTTNMRRKYGNDTLQQITHNAVTYKSIIFPFSLGLKKLTGNRTPQFYRQTMDELKEKWSNELDALNVIEGDKINQNKKKVFTSYQNPTWINDSTIVLIKSGFRDIAKVISLDINTGKERKLFEPGLISSSNTTLSSNGKYIVWAQQDFHPRWGLQEFSEVWAYDIAYDKLIKITNDTRYFTPSIHPDGSRIAAVEVTTDQTQSIVVLASGTGEPLAKRKLPFRQRISYPVWQGDDLICIIHEGGNNALYKFSTNTGNFSQLTPSWKELISFPVVDNRNIYFTGTFEGVDNIYKWNIDTKLLYRITNSRFGARQASKQPGKREMIYADYTNQGYDLRLLSEGTPEVVNYNELYNAADFASPLIKSENNLTSLPNRTFSSSDLRETKGLINVHSWTPWFLPPNFGFGINADNLLSTFSASADISYNTNEMASTYGINLEYAKYFPVFEVNISRANRSRYVPVYSQEVIDNVVNPSLGLRTQQWLEDDVNLGMVIPLNTTWKNYFSSITWTQQFHRKWINYDFGSITDPNADLGTDESFYTYSMDINSYFLRRMARQHLYPRFGLVFNAKMRRTFGTSDNQAIYNQTLSRLYLPGIGRNHHLFVTFRTQSEDYLSRYKFRDDFFYARGHGAVPHDELFNFSLDYALPLLYPDLPLGPFFFIQRIKSTMFFDQSQAKIGAQTAGNFARLTEIDDQIKTASTNPLSNDFRSVGFELTFDVRFLRVLDIDAGFRYNYLLGEENAADRSSFQVILLSVGY